MKLLDINKLYEHPKNPRQNVGDVTELAASIKANGIYQNLTVIEGGPGMPKCKNCIFPDKCINFGKEFCKTMSIEVEYNFVETDAGQNSNLRKITDARPTVLSAEQIKLV